MKTINMRKPFAVCASIILCLSVANLTIRHIEAKRVVRIYQARNISDWDKVIDETDGISILSNIDPISGTPPIFYRGLAHYFNKDNKKALESFDKAQKIAPNHLYVLMNYAGLSAINGQFQQARNIYAKVDSMYPDFPDRKRQ